MKPEIAAVVADKMLQRPLEGMPLNWYVSGTGSDKLAAVKRVLGPTMFAAFTAFVVLQNGGVLPRSQKPSKGTKEGEQPKDISSDIDQTLVATETSFVGEPQQDVSAGEESFLSSQESIPATSPEEVVPQEDGNWLEELMSAIRDTLSSVFNLEESFLKKLR